MQKKKAEGGELDFKKLVTRKCFLEFAAVDQKEWFQSMASRNISSNIRYVKNYCNKSRPFVVFN
jgi:hypothetical protein